MELNDTNRKIDYDTDLRQTSILLVWNNARNVKGFDCWNVSSTFPRVRLQQYSSLLATIRHDFLRHATMYTLYTVRDVGIKKTTSSSFRERNEREKGDLRFRFLQNSSQIRAVGTMRVCTLSEPFPLFSRVFRK